jgi:antitoxin component YwqK of YwqJK toxin-antitoxin module
MRLTCLLFLLSLTLGAQQTNQLDENGQRTGVWKKYFEGTTQLRYEGAFINGKETGLFKFYSKKSGDSPIITRQYKDDSPYVEVKFYAFNGRVVSEGSMMDKLREGTWTTYHKDGVTPMSIESYKKGKLEGEYTIFYKNGVLSESFIYSEGKKMDSLKNIQKLEWYCKK